MRDGGPVGGEELPLVLVRVDHVGQDRSGPRDPEVAQVLDVRAAAPRPHELDLVAVLGGVRVDEDPLRTGPGGRLPEDPVGAGDGEARAPGEAEPPVGPAVPAREEPLPFLERLFRLREELGRVRRRVVHQRVPARHPEARRLRRAKDGVGVPHRSHVEDRGRPACSQLREAEARREEERLLVVGGFAGPDVRLQPGKEREVVRAVAQERLAEVDVGLDESGEAPESLRVDPLDGLAAKGGGPGGGPCPGAEGADDPVFGPDGAARVKVVGGTHPGDEGVLDEKGAHSAEYRPAGAARRDGMKAGGTAGTRPGAARSQGADGAGGQGVSGRCAAGTPSRPRTAAIGT